VDNAESKIDVKFIFAFQFLFNYWLKNFSQLILVYFSAGVVRADNLLKNGVRYESCLQLASEFAFNLERN
jgi:hypothetical protein